MKGFSVKSLLGSGLLLIGLTANAQVYGDYRGAREPLDRVRADLDRAAENIGYLSRGEFARFNHAREEIAEFQDKWNRGFFDRHELDDVIGSLQHVVSGNRLRYEDRDILFYDLQRLREIRARGGAFGYRRGYNDDDRRGYYDNDRYGYRR
jgi:hypothetical protein